MESKLYTAECSHRQALTVGQTPTCSLTSFSYNNNVNNNTGRINDELKSKISIILEKKRKSKNKNDCELFQNLIRLIPKNIIKIIDQKDWLGLEIEINKILNKMILIFDNKWAAAHPKNYDSCMMIAAIYYYLICAKEYRIAAKELPYWCWSHHEAFEVNDYIISLSPEPERLNCYKQCGSYASLSEQEIKKTILSPILKRWLSKGVNLFYPTNSIFVGLTDEQKKCIF